MSDKKQKGDEIGDLIQQLKENQNDNPSDNPSKLTRENFEEYVFDKLSRLLDASVSSVEDLKDELLTTVDDRDPEKVSAYAEMIKAASKVVENASKIHIYEQQNKNRKEVKQMEIDARLGDGSTTNNNYLIATREEVIKELLANSNVESASGNKEKKEKAIDV